MKHHAITFALALLAGAACNPKHDTSKPDEPGGVCPADAKVCADGSSVERTGPNCEFPACPDEGDAKPDGDAPEGDTPAGDTPEGDAKPEGDAPTPEAAPAE